MNIVTIGSNLVISIPLLWVGILVVGLFLWGLVVKRGGGYRS